MADRSRLLTPWDEGRDPVITENFSKLVVAFHKAISNKEIVGVVTPPGAGFKFALQSFARKHYLQVVYSSIVRDESFKKFLVRLHLHLCNIKFSNLDPRRIELFDLTREIVYRLRQSDYCLLCVDITGELTPEQFGSFVSFLRNFNAPMGLVFRLKSKFSSKLQRHKKFADDFIELSKIHDNWRILDKPKDDEMREIARFWGIDDAMLIDDLLQFAKGNLSTLKIGIDRINRNRRADSVG